MRRGERALCDRWALVEGCPLYARVAGHRDPATPTIVLVHGAFIASRDMVPAATRLAAYATVYAPDLPGYGRSARPVLADESIRA